MTAGRGKKRKKTGGRRANYAPAVTEVGYRKYLPAGWANWLGFCLFLFVGGAISIASVTYMIDGLWVDATAAVIMGGALLYMVYLFGTTRLRD